MSAPEAARPRTDPYAGTDPTASADLFCAELFPTPAGGDARGVVRIHRPWTPFGVSVDPRGVHRHRLHAWVEDLPRAEELGGYGGYLAWAAPLTLDSLVPLGEVSNGRNDLGEVALGKYLLLITAEPDLAAVDRTGPMVLRGRSPSSRLEAHDLLALAPAADLGSDGHPHSERRASGWSLPPMYPGVPMLPGVMELAPTAAPYLPGAPAELPEASAPGLATLPDGGTLDLVAGFAKRNIAGRELTLMAFNGQVPGPLISVTEGSTIFVNFTNLTPMPTAVHWHGLRLDNRFDGVPGVTQDPVAPGGSFRYQVYFPDAGIYWYHPHHREDVTQELGLSGNMLVASADPDYYGPADREEALMLDDLLVGEEGFVPFGEGRANYALMGRFGNILLANGEPDYRLNVGAGEVVRFHLTNASNTRTFNLSVRRGEGTDAETARNPGGSEDALRLGPPIPLKVVASDVGRFEREIFQDNVALAPAERYVIEALFEAERESSSEGREVVYRIVNHVQGVNHRLGVFQDELRPIGTITVEPAARDMRTATAPSSFFPVLRENANVIGEMDRFRSHFERPVDHELTLTLRTDGMPPAIEQSMLFERAYANPVEWTGTMPVMNWASTGKEVSWILRDQETGAENGDISWTFALGEIVKIRLVNDRWAFHTMQHPLHIHGQRFLVVEQDGIRNDNLVWKDTALLPAGSTTDILLELSNPGRWMVHCHIAEHLESGMSFVFEVVDER